MTFSQDDLDRRRSLPERIKIIIHTFSPGEKLVFLLLLGVFVVSGLVIAGRVNSSLLIDIPSRGGSFQEGIVGSPRFINPLLAQSDADRDLTALIYSGLMKATPDGGLVYDLARAHTVSEDGLSYTFILKDNVTFHDGEPVTADDVVFTIRRVQDSTLKSPKRASWEGVLVEKINDTEILFTLERPYAPFIQNLTLGILPEHMWEHAVAEEFTFSQFNIEPVGSGPYALRTIKRDSSGIPEYYELKAFGNYSLGEPFIERIRVYFFPSENFLIDAYINGTIDATNSISVKNLAYARLNKEEMRVENVPLPRIFGVFLNQNQAPIFSHIEVRAALDAALNKERVINEVLAGYGVAIDSPILPGVLGNKSVYASTTTTTEEERVSGKKRAIDILERNGWEVNESTGIWEKETDDGVEQLAFSISTSNIPELKAVMDILKEEWEAIGASVTLKVFETGDLNQNVIRPRRYDALLFGEIVGRELDLFAFWHSSQRNDPGLNIALYANITTDKLLEEIRTVQDEDERTEKLIQFEEELLSDIPAIFVYAPDFIYAVPQRVTGIRLGTVATPSERFLNIHEWYMNTDSIWKLFKN